MNQSQLLALINQFAQLHKNLGISTALNVTNSHENEIKNLETDIADKLQEILKAIQD
jgi:hypothetical protein